jgi:hypothetical protein
MSIKNDFGSLFIFSKSGKLLSTLDNVEFVKHSSEMLIDGKQLNYKASNMVKKVVSDRILRDDQIKLVTAYLFDYPLVENGEGFYYDGGGHSDLAIIYKDPSDSSKVITLTMLEKSYENLTAIEF